MKAIIIEDESIIVKDLKRIIQENARIIEVVSTFKNGLDAIVYLQENDVDVMFVDINIPLLNGMSLAKTINKFEYKPHIIFITAHKEYAVEAFEIKAFDYVLKPYSKERIIEIVKNVEATGKRKNIQDTTINENKTKTETEKYISRLSVRDNGSIEFIDMNDIYYLKSDDKTTYVYTSNRQYEIHSCIADVETQLSKDFFRCHRSYIVNIGKIKSIESSGVSSYKVTLLDKEDEVLVGRRKIKELKEIMNIK